MEIHTNEKGEIQFSDTGDPLIDRWEAQIAQGLTPDLTEAFDKDTWERTKARLARAKAAKIGRTLRGEDSGAIR